jgi:hypothetical protein
VPLAGRITLIGDRLRGRSLGGSSALDPARQGVSDVTVSFGRGVLVDQRGVGAVVSHPRLEVGEAAACLRGQRIPGVAEIMEVETRGADGSNGRQPPGITAEIAAP